jgi:Cellulase (glycosyl hydrolase family 5)/Ca-dependent carbohydrate-binding module xylan-binding
MSSTTTASGGMKLIGVNISGGEFGSVPGTMNTDYVYPSQQEIDYYASQGMTVIRVPFLAERIWQNGSLSQPDLQALQNVVSEAAKDGMAVDLDMHDYGYISGNEILPGNSTEQEYDQIWSALATQFKSDPNVIFGLMNEPNAQTPSQQATIDNDAIAAIRNTGANQEVFVPGTDWTGGWTWVSSGNAAAINPSTIVDPDHNWAIEVHQYLDSDGSGTNYGPITDPNIGVERLTSVTQWAEQNGVKLFLGEIGVPSDSQSLTALQNTLNYMEQNSSAWQGLSYWAGGAWWGSYPFSIEPTGLGTSNVQNAPQMNILKQFASGGSSSSGGGSTPSPNDTVIKAGSGSSITDANGNVWTITSSNTVDENGSAAGYTANVTEMAYVNGNVWHENTSGNWYEWNGSGGWNTGSDPLPTPSPNDTVIKASSNGSITDANGDVWTITNTGSVDMNGSPAGYSANVIELAYVNGNVWQENSSNLWWEWQNNSWQPGAGTSQSPLPAGSGSYPAVTTGSGPDSLVLQISENAWTNGGKNADANGDAEFTVSINGVQQGGTFTALAPHATSDGVTVSSNPGEQTFTFNGSFGNGAHTVAVTFINDAYGGSPTTDRNLYVDSVTYNGVNTKQSSPIYADGTKYFTVTGGTIPSGTGTVTVPTAAAVAQGATAAVAGIQINDPGAATASGNMTLNIKDSADALILSGQSYAAGAGAHVTGTEAQLNADLATLGVVGSKAGSITLDVITQSGVQQEETIPVSTFQSSSAMSFIYNSGSAVTAPAPSSSSPIIYEAESAGTGILTISNFRFGTDSLQLGAGVTITSQAFSSGVIDLNLSNHGQIVLHHS